MQQSILTKIKLFILRNRQNRIFRKCVQVLCCMVVFVTTYALILPAITMEQDVFCGKEAHEHTEECLQPIPVPVPVCTPESLGIHTHSGSCYNADGTVICGQADYVVHSHSGSCYDAAGQLLCLLPERGSHVHGESCYVPGETQPETLHVHSEDCYIQEKGELTCTEEEREGHSHGDQCYGPGDLLECTLAERHVHDASCYSLPLTCSLSTEPHVHSAECYGAGNLQCSTPEYHTHENSCWDRSLSCGKSEGGHQHSGSCWETVQVCQNSEETHIHGEGCTESRLICGLTEESHYHDDSCYTAILRCQIPENHAHSSSCYESILVCGKEAGQAHEHNDSCYGTEPQLQCRMPENHVHDSGCYNQILNCEVPEDPGHRHEDACYQWESVLNCGMEEGQPEPTEPPEPVLACTEPEAPVHVHGDSCFELQEKTCQGGEDHQHTDSCYTCGLEAHEHTLICYSDPDADVESPEVWKATFAHVTLTGDWPTDVVAIAETQLGYTESTRNYDVWEDNSIHGYTRYGAWYGVPHGDWCGMFASFCLNYAEVKGMPHNYGVRPWIEDLTKLGLYYTAKETKAQKGNLIFFDWDADGLSDHVGIVAEVQEPQEHTGASVKTIEGNSGNAVRYQHYDPNDPVILGYGLLPGQERIPLIVEEEPADEQSQVFEQPDSLLEILICGTSAHFHSDSCYDQDGTLICEIPDHIHTVSCVSPSSPVGYVGQQMQKRMLLAPRSEGSIVYYENISSMLSQIKITDKEGNTVYSNTDDSGTKTITLGDHYAISLYFSESTYTQFDTQGDGKLYYNIPSNLMCDTVTDGTFFGKILVDKDNDGVREEEVEALVATYTIIDNQLVVTPALQPNYFEIINNAYIQLSFDAEAVDNSSSDKNEIKFNDYYSVTVNIQENGTLEKEKRKLSFDPETKTVTFQATMTAVNGAMEIENISDWWWGNTTSGNQIKPADTTYQIVSIIDTGKDEEHRDVTDQWSEPNEATIWTAPYDGPYRLNRGESLILTYKITFKDYVTENMDFYNVIATNANPPGGDSVYSETDIEVDIIFPAVNKYGNYATEEINGIKREALEWTVVIGDPEQESVTVTDKLGPGQTYCKEQPLKIEARREDGTTEYFEIDWIGITCNTDNTEFSYTLPIGYVEYKLIYYSHYTFTQTDSDTQTFTNNVTTNLSVNNQPVGTSGSMDVFGIPPAIDKVISAIDDEYLTYNISCIMPAQLNNQTGVMVYDQLASWGTDHGYFDNNPQDLVVTVTKQNGEVITLKPYDPQQPAEGTYLLEHCGQTFNIYFNTADKTGTVWKFNEDTKLTISYKIPFSTPLLTGWEGSPTETTLLQFLRNTRQGINNDAHLQYAPNHEISDDAYYVPVMAPTEPLTKTGRATGDDGVYSYSVWFSSGANEDSIFDYDTESSKNNVDTFVLSDTFDSRMEYVPGSFQVNIWQYWNYTTLHSIYVPRDDLSLANGSALTVSAADLILKGGSEDETLLAAIQNHLVGGYQYEFIYKLQVIDDVKKEATVGTISLDNKAKITWTNENNPGGVEYEAQTDVSYRTGVLDKTMDRPNAFSNKADFTITVNPNEKDLDPDADKFVLNDIMSDNLSLLYDTITIKVLDKDTHAEKSTLTLEECQFAYNPDENLLSFLLPDNKFICIAYTCEVSGTPNQNVDISNAVEIVGKTSIRDVVDSKFLVKKNTGQVGGSNDKFYLMKLDSVTKAALPKATFELYGDTFRSGAKTITVGGQQLYFYKEFTTGENGVVEVEDSQLLAEHLYALVETVPPAGYVKKDEPILFYMEYAPSGGMEIDIIPDGNLYVIQNDPETSYVLPATGGVGHELYTVGGMLLMMAAVLLLYSQRKCRKEDYQSS